MKKSLSKILTIAILFTLPFLFNLRVNAVEDPIIVDGECTKYIILGSYVNANGDQVESIDKDGKPFCNDTCRKSLIISNGTRIANKFCVYGSTEETTTINGIDLSLPLEPSKEDSALMWLRAGVYAVMGLTGLGLILYGLYGWYLRAMSEGSEDKIKESYNIYKNAIIGAIIVFSAVVIAQVVFNLVGLTESVFEFNFIPKAGYTVDVEDTDTGRYCYSNQVDRNGDYKCIYNKWTWVGVPD